MRSAAERVLLLAERIDPARTALVVVDTQNDFCHPEGAQGRLGLNLSDIPAMAENVARLVDAARRCGAFIVWVRAVYDQIVQGPPIADRVVRRPAGERALCIEGSFGADWYGRVRPRAADNEVVVTKHRNSAFWDTPIDLYLRANGVRSVVLTGTATSGCVDSNARDAYFRDYFIVLASDACASESRARHDASLAKLAYSYAEVVTTAQVLDLWSAAAGAERGWQAEAKAALVPADDASLLDPAAAALLLVDVDARIAALAEVARRAGVLVVHVRSRASAQSESPASRHRAARLQCKMQDPAPMAPPPGDLLVEKFRESGFVDTRLEILLRANGVRCVVLAGTDAAGGIDATARDAAMRDFHAVLVSDAVAADPQILAALGKRYALMFPGETIRRVWEARAGRPGNPPG